MTTVKVNNRRLEPGVEVSISGQRGRFRFTGSALTSTGLTVLNFIGGPAGHPMMRSFYPEKVKRVHRRRGPSC